MKLEKFSRIELQASGTQRRTIPVRRHASPVSRWMPKIIRIAIHTADSEAEKPTADAL
jgi:hypothetical protein